MTSINKNFMATFKKYLDKEGIPYRDGKGEYQALQIYLNSRWEVLYLSKATPLHANAKTEALSKVVKSFLQTI